MRRHFLFRNPDFCLVWLGQVFSQSGGRMYQIAMVWWILGAGLSGAGKAVGFFMVMAALPSILFVRRIGRTVDRHLSQRILVSCDLAASGTVALVAVLLSNGLLQLPFAFVAGFLAACLQAFIDPTLNKSVAEVTRPEDVESAVALLASTQSLANFAGAVAGALLIGRLGIAGTAFFSACGYLVSSSCSAAARFRYAKPAATGGADAEVSGWAVMERYPFLKKVLVGFGLINFFATPTIVVLPIYTKKTLLGTAATLGKLEASLWMGLILGTFVSRLFRARSRIRLGAICLGVFGLGLATPGLLVQVPVYLISLFVAGLALGVNNVKFMAYFQEAVAPELKGRFFALMQAVIGFTFPIAYFLFGALTDYLSPPQVCCLQGAGVIALAFYFLSLAREEGGSSVEKGILVNHAVS